MKAAMLQDWKKIEVIDVETPRPGPGEAVLRVSYAGICGSDVHIFNGFNPIAITPVIPGHEFIGQIAEIGLPNETGLSVGDRVVVQPYVSCGQCNACRKDIPHICEKLVVIGVNQNGGFAEHVRVPIDQLIPIPDDIPDTVAVLTEPFSIGYHTCQRGGLTADDRVLVIGAGPIGLYAAIVARELGARTVVISEPSEQRRLQAGEIGFASIDPTTEDWLESARGHNAKDGFDMIIETSGLNAGLDAAVRAAAIRGRIVSLGFPADNFASYNVTQGIVKELSLIGSRVCPTDEFRQTMQLLSELYRGGRVDFDRLVSDIRPLEGVESSITDTESGRYTGKILIKAE